MQRTIASLMLLGVLTTGCDGGGSGLVRTPTPSPTPQVTVTASSATLEGGETAALTVKATDGNGASLNYTLNCTSGKLVGNLLVTSPVTADTIVECTASATDAANRTVSGKTSFVVKPATSSLALSAASDTIASGGMVILSADNLPLSADQYDAKLGSRTIKVLRTGNQIVAGIPLDEPAGDKVLSIQIGSKLYAFEIKVGAAPTVANPRQAVTTALGAAANALNEILTGPSPISAGDRARFEQARDNLAQAPAALSGMNDADVAKLASFFAANGLIAPQGQSARFININQGPSCGVDWAAFKNPAFYSLLGALFVGGAINIGILVAETAPGLVVPDIIIAGLAGGGGLMLLKYNLPSAISSWDPMYTSCFQELEVSLKPLPFPFDGRQARGQRVQAITVAQKQGFAQNETRAFLVERSFAPGDAIKSSITPIVPRLVSTVQSLGFLPASLTNGLSKLILSGTETIPGGRVSLAGISKSNIVGSVGHDGDAITLTFRATDDPLPRGNIDFSFILNRQGEQAVNVNAQLTIDTPEVEDAAITLIQGREANSTVQIRGAESVEILKQPGHGQVSLQVDGSMRFTPSASYFGADEFTFRAKNKAGYSKVATVLLTINRQFEGIWNIHSVSTTTAQSQPGLCPNEDNRFSLGVTKASDTLYSAVYDGITLNFTMASADDPGGLKASIQGTYDDGPGETTESLSVSIPDSNRVIGTSFWSYRGPGNTSCSGSTQITGTR